MKFLCTKVKPLWLTSIQNREKVVSSGLLIKEPFIGLEIKDNYPDDEEYKFISLAIEKLFKENKKAFPIRLIDL